MTYTDEQIQAIISDNESKAKMLDEAKAQMDFYRETIRTTQEQVNALLSRKSANPKMEQAEAVLSDSDKERIEAEIERKNDEWGEARYDLKDYKVVGKFVLLKSKFGYSPFNWTEKGVLIRNKLFKYDNGKVVKK
jgi:hypothetical protein